MATNRSVTIKLTEGSSDLVLDGRLWAIRPGPDAIIAPHVLITDTRPSQIPGLSPGLYNFQFRVFGASGKFTVAAYDAASGLELGKKGPKTIGRVYEVYGLEFKV